MQLTVWQCVHFQPFFLGPPSVWYRRSHVGFSLWLPHSVFSLEIQWKPSCWWPPLIKSSPAPKWSKGKHERYADKSAATDLRNATTRLTQNTIHPSKHVRLVDYKTLHSFTSLSTHSSIHSFLFGFIFAKLMFYSTNPLSKHCWHINYNDIIIYLQCEK